MAMSLPGIIMEEPLRYSNSNVTESAVMKYTALQKKLVELFEYKTSGTGSSRIKSELGTFL